jgi:hypothetical protein
MRSGRFFGTFSSTFSVVGLLAAISAEYLRSIHDPHDGAVLRYLDRWGFVAHDPGAPASMSAVTVYSVNDTNAIIWLYALATYLAVTALLFALLAEYHREQTLSLSIGFIIASAALAYVSVKVGVAVAIVVLVILLIVRARKTRMPTDGHFVAEP